MPQVHPQHAVVSLRITTLIRPHDWSAVAAWMHVDLSMAERHDAAFDASNSSAGGQGLSAWSLATTAQAPAHQYSLSKTSQRPSQSLHMAAVQQPEQPGLAEMQPSQPSLGEFQASQPLVALLAGLCAAGWQTGPHMKMTSTVHRQRSLGLQMLALGECQRQQMLTCQMQRDKA